MTGVTPGLVGDGGFGTRALAPTAHKGIAKTQTDHPPGGRTVQPARRENGNLEEP